MRKLWILCAACLMGISAMAQEINAVKVTQGGTTDWYPFGESDRIDVPITNGNPVFNGKTYDLAQGEVETIFAYKDPTPTSLIEANQSSNVVKFLRNGQLIIVREGKTYNAQGMRLNGTECLQVTENR